MKKAFVLLLAVALLAVLAACGKKPAENVSEVPTAGAFWTLEENRTSLKIALDANATTGYCWQYTIEDPTVLTAEEDEYLPDDVPSGLCGAGGVWNARFTAVGEGSTLLKLTYARSWEDGFAEQHILRIAADADHRLTVTEVQ